MKLSEKDRIKFNIQLEGLMKECILELNIIGIYPSKKISKITANNRAKKRLGCCKKVAEGMKSNYELEISTKLFGSDEKKIKEIILHELLHTCNGCLNHGVKWKNYRDYVNEQYGYKIETTAKVDEENDPPQYKYKITCDNCGIQFYRLKKSNLIKYPENYRCSKCGGKLKVERI